MMDRKRSRNGQSIIKHKQDIKYYDALWGFQSPYTMTCDPFIQSLHPCTPNLWEQLTSNIVLWKNVRKGRGRLSLNDSIVGRRWRQSICYLSKLFLTVSHSSTLVGFQRQGSFLLHHLQGRDMKGKAVAGQPVRLIGMAFQFDGVIQLAFK